MNVVDSSGWLEYFGSGANVDVFAPIIKNNTDLVVPTISMYEVFKRISLQRDEEEALVLGQADEAADTEADETEADADADASDDMLELGEAHVADDADTAEPEVAAAQEDISDLPREPAAPPPRVSAGGGTLFERMTNL